MSQADTKMRATFIKSSNKSFNQSILFSWMVIFTPQCVELFWIIQISIMETSSSSKKIHINRSWSKDYKLRALERKLGCKLSQSLSGQSEELPLHAFLHQNNDAPIGYFNNNNNKDDLLAAENALKIQRSPFHAELFLKHIHLLQYISTLFQKLPPGPARLI